MLSSINNKSYFCSTCKLTFHDDEGYIDFLPNSEFYAGEVPRSDMIQLAKDIDTVGYNEGIKNFCSKYPNLRSYIIGQRRTDWVYHALGQSNKRCLDIGSGLGNISENLSNLYEEVYSLEAVKERIDFQVRRFRHTERSNIRILRANGLKIPFDDNTFDLIVCNGVLEWIGMMNTTTKPEDTQLEFLRELKRLINENGVIYIGIENRIGLEFFLGASDHSGIPFTSLMPRVLANLVVKKFGPSGGIYGDKTLAKKEERGYFTYTYSLSGYKELFKRAGLRVRPFWVFPSYNEPYYAGNTEDKNSAKGLLNFVKKTHPNYSSLSKKYKFLLDCISYIPKSGIKLVTNLFTPSFLFYCYKGSQIRTIDDHIMYNSENKSFTRFSEGNTIKYLLYDRDGKPSKIAHVRRDLQSIPERIMIHDNTNPHDLPQLTEKIWFSNWINGKKLDPLNMQEINLALDWLFSFQNRNFKTEMDILFVDQEIKSLKSDIMKIPEYDIHLVLNKIENYRSYLLNNKIRICPEHGDFWHGNILIDMERRKLSVIDWEYYREYGDPLFDISFFIINTILSTNPKQTNGFVSNIRNKPELKNIFQRIEAHLGFAFDHELLLYVMLLKYSCRRRIEKGPLDEEWLKYYNFVMKMDN